VSDRPKTMAERTQKVVGGKIVPRQPQVSDDAPALPDAAMAWTGTSLSTALTNAQAAEAQTTESHVERSSDSEESRRPEAAKRPKAHASPSGGGSSSKAKHAFAAARAVARKLALQAIYRWLLNDAPWQDLVKEFGEAEDMPNADPQYFRALVEGVWDSRKSLDERLAELVDRPVEQLDPVEHAVLLVGLYELSARPDVPYRVAINEAVGLAKRFGATDGHKFVNAVLDRAARTLRPGEN
jgi:N utilization substance protein B